MSQVKHFKDFIPQAFPGASSLILDSEVLLIDTKRGKPLPFGTLGVHKAGFKNANLWYERTTFSFLNLRKLHSVKQMSAYLCLTVSIITERIS